MKTKFWHGLLILILCTACSGGGDDTASTPFDASLSISENVDHFFAQTLAPEAPGAAVLIVKDGIAVHQQSYGLADLATGELIETYSQFELASAGKQCTALGVMLLFDWGLIDFDDPIVNYLPELPTSWGTITIRYLLSHQSGIPDYLNEIFSAEVVQTMTNRDVIAYFATHPDLHFEPGSRFRYSNSGFVILAELIDRVSGLSFRDFMHMNVFDPLGMTLTTIHDDSLPELPALTTGYQVDGAVSDFDLMTVGDAGVISTIDDLFVYQQALLSGQLVRPETLDMAFADQTSTGAGYGFGWGISQYRGHILNGHNGGLPGYATWFGIVRDLDLTIIILTNFCSYSSLISTLNTHILNYYINNM